MASPSHRVFVIFFVYVHFYWFLRAKIVCRKSLWQIWITDQIIHTYLSIVVVVVRSAVAACRRLSVNIDGNAFCNPFNSQIRFCKESNSHALADAANTIGGESACDFCLHNSTFCLRFNRNNLKALCWTFLSFSFMHKSTEGNLCRAQQCTSTSRPTRMPQYSYPLWIYRYDDDGRFFHPHSTPAREIERKKEQKKNMRKEWSECRTQPLGTLE